MKKKKNRRKRSKGCGIGPHHEVSPMGHGTKTKNKKDRLKKQDKLRKQKGWYPW